MTEETLVDTPAGYYPLKPVHYLSRELLGHTVNLPLPLCWDMYGRETGATDDEWWITADHEVVDFDELVFAQAPLVTCKDCLEWIHA